MSGFKPKEGVPLLLVFSLALQYFTIKYILCTHDVREIDFFGVLFFCHNRRCLYGALHFGVEWLCAGVV